MRILGIDPGLQTTGFGVVDAEGAQLRYVASGTIRTQSAACADLPARLKLLFDGIHAVVARYQPQAAVVEIEEAVTTAIRVVPKVVDCMSVAPGMAVIAPLTERPPKPAAEANCLRRSASGLKSV